MRYRNIIIMLLSIALLFLIDSGNPSAQGNKTLYVGGSGEGNYTSIQDAIDDATDGDKIIVYGGTYYENIVIDKSIELIGKDRNSTIIDADYKGDVVKIKKDGVVVSGFTIRNSERNFEKAGIIIQNSRNIVIENNIIENNGDQGIRIFSSDYDTIRNNVIMNNTYYGIWMYNSRENKIIHNTFVHNGLVIREGRPITFLHQIENNSVNGRPLYYYVNKNNFSIPSDAGEVILVNCTHINVDNLSISNASVGVEIAYSSHIRIFNNNLSYNNLNGVRLYYSCNNDIFNNVFAHNGWGGLSLWYSRSNNIFYNHINNNLYDDVEILFSSNRNKIWGNDIAHSPYGIGLMNSDGNIIHFNNIHAHQNYGIIAQNAVVNARWNWWGSAFGVIIGDKMAAKDGWIYVFPWLPFPSPLFHNSFIFQIPLFHFLLCFHCHQ